MSLGENQGVARAAFLLEALRRACFLTSPSCPHFLAHDLVPPCSKASNVRLSPSHAAMSVRLAMALKGCLALSTQMETGPSQISQDNLSPCLRVLNFSHIFVSSKPLSLCKVAYSQVLGIRLWTSLSTRKGGLASLSCACGSLTQLNGPPDYFPFQLLYHCHNC